MPHSFVYTPSAACQVQIRELFSQTAFVDVDIFIREWVIEMLHLSESAVQNLLQIVEQTGLMTSDHFSRICSCGLMTSDHFSRICSCGLLSAKSLIAAMLLHFFNSASVAVTYSSLNAQFCSGKFSIDITLSTGFIQLCP